MSPGLQYGKRLLPQIVDSIADRTPHRIFACLPRSENLGDGFRDVTFGELASSVHFFCRWLISRTTQLHKFETLSYIGVQDLRSAIVFLAAVKLGYKVFLPSPRNTVETNFSLMDQMECKKFLYTAEVTHLANNMAGLKVDVEYLEIPSFKEMLQGFGEPFLYQFEFEDVVNHPVLVLHSSGSTGRPKPIIITHGSFSVLDNDATLPTIHGRKNRNFSMWNELNGGKYYTAFPYCHLAGFVSIIVQPLITNCVPVLGPPLTPPSGSLLAEILTYNSIKAIFVPPSIAEQLLQEHQGLVYFTPLSFVCYIGGPLSPASGHAMNSVTSVRQFYGSTEVFMVPQLELLDTGDWEYFEWHPSAEIEMRHSAAAGAGVAHELLVLGGLETARRTALSHNLLHMELFHTKDLFIPHPHKKDLWKYLGRTDDIIVLSNGEKLNPVPMELAVQTNQFLQGVLVVGNGKQKPVLLVEPNETINSGDRKNIIEKIWQSVQKANKISPKQGQISKSRVLVASRDKPFLRAGKGTIIRRMTEVAYAEEISALSRLGDLKSRL